MSFPLRVAEFFSSSMGLRRYSSFESPTSNGWSASSSLMLAEPSFFEKASTIFFF
jgi:hypothetical protein